MDGKDLNAIRGGFLRQGFTETNEGGLTDDVSGERGYGLHAGDTCYIDDPSPMACAHT